MYPPSPCTVRIDSLAMTTIFLGGDVNVIVQSISTTVGKNKITGQWYLSHLQNVDFPNTYTFNSPQSPSH